MTPGGQGMNRGTMGAAGRVVVVWDLPTRAFHWLTVALVAWLLLCPTGSPVRVADAQTVGPLDQATIFFSFAPWDGAAYDIEIPLEHVEGAAQPNIRINITGYAHDSTNH